MNQTEKQLDEILPNFIEECLTPLLKVNKLAKRITNLSNNMTYDQRIQYLRRIKEIYRTYQEKSTELNLSEDSISLINTNISKLQFFIDSYDELKKFGINQEKKRISMTI